VTNIPESLWATDNWRFSPVFWEDEVQGEMSLPERVGIRSVDIRHPPDQAGIVFTLDDRMRIAEVIADLGVPELECGWPGENQGDYDIVKAMGAAGIDIVKSGMVRILVDNAKEQMDACVEAGSDNIKISMVPPALSSAVDGDTSMDEGQRHLVAEKAHFMIDYAHELGIPISFCFVHTWRGDLEWMMKILKQLPIQSTEKFYVYEDSIATPASVRWLVRQFKNALPDTPIVAHCHDSFGLSTANALASVEGGAEWLDVGFNGYVGSTRLEQVVPALEMIYGIDTGIKLEKLYDASKTIARITGVVQEPHAPVIGDRLFTTTSGGGAANIIRGKTGFWAYDPTVVGQRNNILWESHAEGKTLSSEVLKLKVDQLGLEYTDESLKELENRLDKIIEQRKSITDAEFDDLCRRLLSSRRGGGAGEVEAP
jgi:isopropylmalate/homocitrate/citramalate synthase